MAGTITGREAQLAELAAVAGLHASDGSASHERRLEPAPPLVMVYGGVSTGKSRCVHHALHASTELFALVDCTGVMATREFYREILGQLQRHSHSRSMKSAGVRPRDGGGGELGGGDEDTTARSADADASELFGDDVTITDAPLETTDGHQRRKRSNGKDAVEERKGGKSNVDDGFESDKSAKKPKAASKKHAARAARAPVEDSDDDENDDNEDNEADTAAAHGSLNFLSFVKALRGFMDDELSREPRRPKPTVYVALDHIETMMDRGFEKLLTCLLAVNDQLDYLHVFDANGAPWRLCVVVISRAVSLNLDLFLNGAHPALIHFPAYTKEEVASIVSQNLLDAARPSSMSIYTPDEQRERAAWLRKWLVGVYDLLSHCHNDWLEFQHVVVEMLPSFDAFFDIVSVDEHAPLPQLAGHVAPNGGVSAAKESCGSAKPSTNWKNLQIKSRECVTALEKSRRRHLFGYDSVGGSVSATVSGDSDPNKSASGSRPDFMLVPVTSGDPVAFITSSKLSRSCLLLLVACYLASFTPHEADSHFVSSSGGVKRKRRIMRTSAESGGSNGTPSNGHGKGKKTSSSSAAARKAMNQQVIGPNIFPLPRLLAIYASLQIESDAALDGDPQGLDEATPTTCQAAGSLGQAGRSTRTRADIFTHLSLLIRLRLLQRASPPSDLDQPLFRCIADTRLVGEIARHLRFPLDSYLNMRG